MFLRTKKIINTYERISKSGKKHTYKKTKTLAEFSCDACRAIFQRSPNEMDRRRFNNDYHHVCSNCDPKKFAQKKGVERRRLWNLPVDSDIDISKIH